MKYIHPAIFFLFVIFLAAFISGCDDKSDAAGQAGTAAETYAMTTLRSIMSAEALYKSNYNSYGTLKNMADAGVLSSKIAAGRIDGYTLSVTADNFTFTALAEPENPGATRAFRISPSGILETAPVSGGEWQIYTEPKRSETKVPAQRSR